jgi:hypothetical protein
MRLTVTAMARSVPLLPRQLAALQNPHFFAKVFVQKRPLTSFQIYAHMYYIIDLQREYARGTDSCSKPASCDTSLTPRHAFISPSNQVSEEEFIRIMKKTSLY